MDVDILKGDFAGRNVKMRAHVRIPHVKHVSSSKSMDATKRFFPTSIFVTVFSCLSVGVGLEEVGE